jgi:transposase
MPVVVATAYLWSAEQLLPSTGGDLRAARLLAATGRTRGLGERVHSEDAEGPHRDERAVGQRDQRHQRPDGTDHHSGDSGWRADRYKLAALADARIQASGEDIARSLEGNWRKELLFILQQELNLYQVYQEQIAECDTALAAHLQTLEDKVEPGSQPPVAKAGKKAGSNAPTSFDLRGELYRISGTDLTQIDGINIMNAQTIIAEVGVDMSRFPSEAHFASFLGLCPDNQITGGKVLHRGTRHVENRAATALRMAATSLWRSKTYLGAKFRRLRARLGAPKAITAMAHMLARLVYRMLRYGEQYVDKGMKYYEEKYREHEIRSIQKKAKDLGLVVTLTPTTAAG